MKLVKKYKCITFLFKPLTVYSVLADLSISPVDHIIVHCLYICL